MSGRDLLLAGFHKGDYRSEAEDIAYARRGNLTWTSIAAYAETLPQFEEETNQLVRDMIGYYTQPHIYIPYVPMLRGLVAAHKSGSITHIELHRQAEPIIKMIRNDDMEKHGWAMGHSFGAADHKIYDEKLVAYKDLARERLIAYLGYEPQLKFSLYAEVTIRQFFQHDWFHSETPFFPWDHRAATIYHYRKAIMSGGLEAARQSEFVTKL